MCPNATSIRYLRSYNFVYPFSQLLLSVDNCADVENLVRNNVNPEANYNCSGQPVESFDKIEIDYKFLSQEFNYADYRRGKDTGFSSIFRGFSRSRIT